MTSQYRPTQLTTLPKVQEQLTEEALWWRQNLSTTSSVIKEFGPVQAVDSHPITGDILVTSNRIALYNFGSLEEQRSFKNNTTAGPFGAVFRHTDGRLFGSGSENGIVHVHDITESKPLRSFNEEKTRHTSAVRRVRWRQHSELVSFGDDRAVKLWDISTAALISQFGKKESTGAKETWAHSDYIRAGCCLQEQPLVVSGAYDHVVRVWDPRSDPTEPVHEFEIGVPVESVITRGSLVVASGGRVINVYDLVAGKLIKQLSNVHSKTITSLSTLNLYSLSASLDGQVRVYDQLFQPVTHLPTPGSGITQILNLHVTEKSVLMGNVDGSVTVRKFKSAELEKQPFRFEATDQGVTSDGEGISLGRRRAKRARYFDVEVSALTDKKAKSPKNDGDVQHIVNEHDPLQRLDQFDFALKKFRHSESLDVALRHHGSKNPAKVVSLMQELMRRSHLRTALAGRTDKELGIVLDFIVTNLRDPKYIRVLTDVSSILIDLYGPYVTQRRSKNAPQELFGELSERIGQEVELMQQMRSLAGQIEMILNNG